MCVSADFKLCAKCCWECKILYHVESKIDEYAFIPTHRDCPSVKWNMNWKDFVFILLFLHSIALRKESCGEQHLHHSDECAAEKRWPHWTCSCMEELFAPPCHVLHSAAATPRRLNVFWTAFWNPSLPHPSTTTYTHTLCDNVIVTGFCMDSSLLETSLVYTGFTHKSCAAYDHNLNDNTWRSHMSHGIYSKRL